jgi:SAM-dependent methyltransferase
MKDAVVDFYEDLAEHYHLIFDDWDRAIARQASILNPLLHSVLPGAPLKILDCACGIGTQAIGFAQARHHVVGSDLSGAAIARARGEAKTRGLDICFAVSDMTSLQEIADIDFDVIAVLDNALPHLDAGQIERTMRAMASKLKPGGVLLASIRDYDRLIVERPTIQPPAFYGSHENRRIVHQVWDWLGHDAYTMHMYITLQSGAEWKAHHFTSLYRALLRGELTGILEREGFAEVRWMMPPESGYYQPLVIAKRL